MNHPSHPLHPLTLAPYPPYPSNSFFCNSCNLVGTGFGYSCSLCEFDIHIHCAYMSNSTAHVSPQSFASYENNIHQNYVTNNSGSFPAYPPEIYNPQNPYVDHNGPAYPNTSTQYLICEFDLHTDCASLSKTVKRKDHEHPLTLYYEMNGEFRCDACQETSEGCWRYRCRKCDFDTHPYCVTYTAKPVISNPQLDYYNESEEVMAALAAAKIQHDCNEFALSLW
ncbi:hypothetical protein AgCh_000499 [Apium graveolens]